MGGFRARRRGGVTARFAASQASIIRALVSQVEELVAGPAGEGGTAPGPGGSAPGPGGSAPGLGGAAAGLGSPLDDVAALLGRPGPAAPPDDPVLARLLPDAYRDDPEAAGEFRRYTEPALRSAKHQAAQEMLDTLPDAGGRIQLTQDQALSWLKALNDVRLALGVRLGVTEDFEEQWARLKPDDPQWTAFEVYAWLGAVQESLVQALS